MMGVERFINGGWTCVRSSNAVVLSKLVCGQNNAFRENSDRIGSYQIYIEFILKISFKRSLNRKLWISPGGKLCIKRIIKYCLYFFINFFSYHEKRSFFFYAMWLFCVPYFLHHECENQRKNSRHQKLKKNLRLLQISHD